MASAEKASKYLSLVQEAFRKGAKSTVMDDADFEQKHPRAKGGLFAKKGRVAVANGSYEDEEAAYLDIVNRPDANERTTHIAPNGKRSNLTNALYHLVRTEWFKDWFGDWEKLARRNAIDSAPTPTIEVGAFVRNEDESVQDAAKKYFNGSVKYKTVVGEVEIDARSGKDSLAHKYGKEKLDAITSIQRDFANAVYLGSEMDFDGKDIDNHYFCYPINYGGKRRLVFCRVRQDVNKNRLYVHEVFLEDEIKSNALQTVAHASESQKPHGGIALYHSILQSVYAVNPASVSKVVDENGEPLVVSHASNEMFNSFDLSKFGKNDWGFYGAGFYFSSTTAHERQYGRINRHFFLNIRNPFDFTSAGKSEIGDYYGGIGKLKTYEERLEYARSFTDKIVKRGYDGAIANYGIEYIAYKPSQIKSADPVTYDDAGNVIPLSKRFNFSSADIRDEATGRILDIIKNVDAEDASLEWTSGKNPEIQRYRGRRQPIDRVPKKITKQIIVENCKLIKTVDEDMLPLLAGKVYGMLTGKVEADEFIDWCVDECNLEEWQAYRIARDQIVKAREWIKIADWKHRGVSYVMWCHSGKDAEPRDYHVAKWNGKSGLRNGRPNGLNGFVFNIDNPPVIDKKTGTRGLPSTLIGCKCFLRGIKGV